MHYIYIYIYIYHMFNTCTTLYTYYTLCSNVYTYTMLSTIRCPLYDVYRLLCVQLYSTHYLTITNTSSKQIHHVSKHNYPYLWRICRFCAKDPSTKDPSTSDRIVNRSHPQLNTSKHPSPMWLPGGGLLTGHGSHRNAKKGAWPG